MATIIYLHGFGSVGESPKSLALRQAFPEHTVLYPTLPNEPTEIIKQISVLYRNQRDPQTIFVGTSLGGFWSAYFASLFSETGVIVNPSPTPSKSMEQRVGKETRNYSTGELIVITPEIVEEYRRAESDLAMQYTGEKVHGFFAKNDDVLDYRTGVKRFSPMASCKVFESGGHRFDLYWQNVINEIAALIESHSPILL